MISINLFSIINTGLDMFARGGGGGSGGGSGGSGGGAVELVLGYVPMHYVGSLLRRKLKLSTTGISLIGWPIALAYSVGCLIIFKLYGILIVVAALAGMAVGLYNFVGGASQFLLKKARKKQTLAIQTDSAWGMEKLNAQTRLTFLRYQADWSKNDAASMQTYLSPDYWYHNKLMVLALQQLGRRNVVSSPVISMMLLVDITDAIDNTQDRFAMLVSAEASDELYDTTTNTLLFRDSKPFQEYWKFVRFSDTNWLLEGISQVTEDPYMKNNQLAKFAADHQFCYSPDWGWLLLPRRGQLFGSGKFGSSDINNHVIGVYNNTLIQLYNYVPNPSGRAAENYIIAQVALPKTYGNIVVRKKRRFSLFGHKGLTRVKLEWGEFNQRYEVWASDLERVTSLELLNPSFMVKLQELPFEVNIEVVDNIVYLYSGKTTASPTTYDTLLTILYQAFKEMRM